MHDSNNNSPETLSSDLKGTPFCANAHDFSRTTAVIRYHHATAGYPTKETWFKAIEKGKYNSWPGLTVELDRKHCPDAYEIITGPIS